MAERVNDEHDPPQPDGPRDTPPVVGIGASAGGIGALREFFSHVEAAERRRLRRHPASLPRPRQPSCRSAAERVGDARRPGDVERRDRSRSRLRPVAEQEPDDLRRSASSVADFTRTEERRAPVDVFFRALADSHGSRSVAVVLSGTGPNGSAGVKRIKAYGGLVIAQDPAEADYGDMPRNSIATGLVDVILPVRAMPAKIAAYLEHLRATLPRPSRATGSPTTADAMREVLALLRVRTGHDFSNYKLATVRRRVERRMTLREVPSITGYAAAAPAGAGRGRLADAGTAHQRDQLLPRRAGMAGAGAAHHSSGSSATRA